MKRLPTLLVTAFLGATLTTSLQAQTGIKAGVSHGVISNSGVLPGHLGGRTGLAIGVSFATPPTDLLGLGIEGLYAQRGAHSANNQSSYALDYIDVPVYLRVMIPAHGFQPFVYAGPQLSFEVHCGSGQFGCPSLNRPKTTYAGVIGGGVRLGWRGGLSIEGRYMYGLKDLELGTVTTGESYKNRSFEILVGLSFFGG